MWILMSGYNLISHGYYLGLGSWELKIWWEYFWRQYVFYIFGMKPHTHSGLLVKPPIGVCFFFSSFSRYLKIVWVWCIAHQPLHFLVKQYFLLQHFVYCFWCCRWSIILFCFSCWYCMFISWFAFSLTISTFSVYFFFFWTLCSPYYCQTHTYTFCLFPFPYPHTIVSGTGSFFLPAKHI